MIDRVLECLHYAINALATGDEAAAQGREIEKKVVDDLEIRLKDDHVEHASKGQMQPQGQHDLCGYGDKSGKSCRPFHKCCVSLYSKRVYIIKKRWNQKILKELCNYEAEDNRRYQCCV